MSDPGRQEVTAAETVSLQIPREEKDEIKISDLEHAKKARRKAKLEGHLKAGCGYGKKRQKLLDAFWGIVWSGLEKLGWRKVRSIGFHTNGFNQHTLSCCHMFSVSTWL